MSSLLNDLSIRSSVEPISVQQYQRMGEAGIIDTGTELIRGVILRKTIKSPLHTRTVNRLVEALLPQISEAVELRKEEPLTLESSEPEPDIALVSRGAYDPLECHPSCALLVIEVATSSESLDRAKAAIYAAAGIPEYWLVLPDRQRVERFTVPQGEIYLNAEIYDYFGHINSGLETSVAIDLRQLKD